MLPPSIDSKDLLRIDENDFLDESPEDPDDLRYDEDEMQLTKSVSLGSNDIPVSPSIPPKDTVNPKLQEFLAPIYNDTSLSTQE